MGPPEEGQLIVLASGPEGTRAQLEPIFDAIGRKTLWLGPAGNGTRLKLVLNDWLASLTEGVAETIALTEALGLDPQLFIDAIDDGPLGSPYAVAKARAALGGELAPGFALRLAFKDVGLALDAARKRNLELPITDAIFATLAAGDCRRPCRRGRLRRHCRGTVASRGLTRQRLEEYR